MIRLYTRGGCNSSLKAKDWLEAHNIEFEHKKMAQLSHQELLYLLSLTTSGVEEILKLKGKRNRENLQSMLHFSEWSLTECVQFLKYHTDFLHIKYKYLDEEIFLKCSPTKKGRNEKIMLSPSNFNGGLNYGAPFHCTCNGQT